MQNRTHTSAPATWIPYRSEKYTIAGGTTPPETMSASESSSPPNTLVLWLRRASGPSMASRIAASTIGPNAVARRVPRIPTPVRVISNRATKPATRLAVVTALASVNW